MTRCRSCAAGIVGMLLSTTALHAQVTPEQVWQNWRDMATSSGQTVTTTGESRQGDTLVVTGMTFAMTEPGASVSGTLAEVRFRDLGNGTVEVTMSPSYPLKIEATNDAGKAVTIGLELLQSNLKMIAGGSPDSTSYSFTADSMSLATTGVVEDGVAMPVKGNVTMAAPSGDYLVSRGSDGAMDLRSSLNASTLSLVFSGQDAAQGTDVAINASIQGLAMTSGGRFGEKMNMEKVNEALNAGFAVDLDLTYGATSYDLNVTEAAGPTAIKGKVDGGAFGFGMDKAGMRYKGGARGVEVLLSGPQIPFPELALRYAETVFDVMVPLSKGNAPQDFRLVAKVRDLTVSDEVWGLFDPMANLPRDPASLTIDARGKATLTADLTDEAATAMGPPGTLEALDLPELLVRIAGAELTGNGALTFDNTDLTTFAGMPAPTGTITLQLVGGNGLLDKLGAMGLIPDDQLMGARMMLGMFARPGNGPDTLISTLEFKDKGFFANGMRLQ